MLPAAFAALLGVAPEVLADMAGVVPALVGDLKAALKITTRGGGFFPFMHILRAAVPGIIMPEIQQAFKVAQYFKDQAKFLSRYDPDVQLDRLLARVIPTPTGLGPDGEPYQYLVRVAIDFHDGEDPVYRMVELPLDMVLSPSDIVELAIQQLFAGWKPRSKPIDYGGTRDEVTYSGRLEGFYMFTRGTS